MTQSLSVVVGVTGGVAGFKTAQLVSQLVQRDVEVTVVMTEAAQRFVGPATFAALTGRPVVDQLFDPRYPLGPHIELARAASLLCVAPASANFLAKAAHGVADDLLSTLYLAFARNVVLAPAMNSRMWNHPAVQRNIAQMEADGVSVIPPTDGWLSCRERGAGRMAEPEQIVERVVSAMGPPGPPPK